MKEDYEIRQDARDREYAEGWRKAPEEFKRKAAAAGLEPRVDRGGQAMEMDENYKTASYSPDMTTLDTQLDQLIEQHGAQNEAIIRSVYQAMEGPMRVEIERNRAFTLGRVVCYLVRGENRNLRASIHGLLHAIPQLAEANGFSSLRESARACGTTPTWMQKLRDEWCHVFGIEVPADGRKSEEAREKYRSPAGGHWRKRKFSTNNKPNETICQTK